MNQHQKIVMMNANLFYDFHSVNDNFAEVLDECDLDMFCIYITDNLEKMNYETLRFNIERFSTIAEVSKFIEDFENAK